jgi:hypothetical protein
MYQFTDFMKPKALKKQKTELGSIIPPSPLPTTSGPRTYILSCIRSIVFHYNMWLPCIIQFYFVCYFIFYCSVLIICRYYFQYLVLKYTQHQAKLMEDVLWSGHCPTGKWNQHVGHCCKEHVLHSMYRPYTISKQRIKSSQIPCKSSFVNWRLSSSCHGNGSLCSHSHNAAEQSFVRLWWMVYNTVRNVYRARCHFRRHPNRTFADRYKCCVLWPFV